MNAGVVDHCVIRHAARFSKAGLFEWEGVGHAMKDAGGNADVACHGPVHSVAEALASRIEVVEGCFDR